MPSTSAGIISPAAGSRSVNMISAGVSPAAAMSRLAAAVASSAVTGPLSRGRPVSQRSRVSRSLAGAGRWRAMSPDAGNQPPVPGVAALGFPLSAMAMAAARPANALRKPRGGRGNFRKGNAPHV